MIDADTLPQRALIDTGVVLRGFWPEQFKGDADTELCRDLVVKMQRSGRRMLIAAPSLAECLRFDPARKLPRHASVEVVAFDQQSAHVHAERLGEADLKPLSEEAAPGVRNSIKVDALIVCAGIRHRAECSITLDAKSFHKLSERAQLRPHHPRDFLSAQPSLPHVP